MKRIITNVIAFQNGMVAVFDQFGHQMPDYQGRKEEVWEKIRRDKTDATHIEDDCVWRSPSERAAEAY